MLLKASQYANKLQIMSIDSVNKQTKQTGTFKINVIVAELLHESCNVFVQLTIYVSALMTETLFIKIFRYRYVVIERMVTGNRLYLLQVYIFRFSQRHSICV